MNAAATVEAGTDPIADARAVAVVDVPSGVKGFVLVLRLHEHHAYNKQAEDGTWHVHVELSAEAVPSLLAAVEQWLWVEQVPETTVRVGGDLHRVTAAARLGA